MSLLARYKRDTVNGFEQFLEAPRATRLARVIQVQNDPQKMSAGTRALQFALTVGTITCMHARGFMFTAADHALSDRHVY